MSPNFYPSHLTPSSASSPSFPVPSPRRRVRERSGPTLAYDGGGESPRVRTRDGGSEALFWEAYAQELEAHGTRQPARGPRGEDSAASRDAFVGVRDFEDPLQDSPEAEIDLLAETQSLLRYEGRFYPVSRLGMEAMRELCLMGVEADRILRFILRQEGHLA